MRNQRAHAAELSAPPGVQIVKRALVTERGARSGQHLARIGAFDIRPDRKPGVEVAEPTEDEMVTSGN